MILRRVFPGPFAIVAFWAGTALSATWVVDQGGGGDFTSIKPALQAAASGDTILVEAGIYQGPANRDLDFSGKDLVLASTQGPEATILDGGLVAQAFLFQSGESSAARVSGFKIVRAPVNSPIRITGGSAPVLADCIVQGNEVMGDGGAVTIVESSPRFESCLLVENRCDGSGGAILISGGSPEFIGCTVIGNKADGKGGGFQIQGAASVVIESCTISGNAADPGGSGTGGGGLMVEGPASAAIEGSIIWGNRADLGEDLWVTAGAAVSVDCSIFDTGGTAGSGSVTLGPDVLDVDPRFCLPGYCQENPWSDGVYTLAAGSPCLPANNACGRLLGAWSRGCGTITVWTGDGATDSWHDPQNWSTGLVPAAGDTVHITDGDVVVQADATAYSYIHCSESTVPDRLTITNGAWLNLGITPTPYRKEQPVKVYDMGQMDVDDGGVFMPCEPEPCGNGPILGGTMYLGHGILEGAPWQNYGQIVVEQNGIVEFLADVINHAGAGAQAGMEFQGGLTTVEARISNLGLIQVNQGAQLHLPFLAGSKAAGGVLEVEPGGLVVLEGEITGSGTVRNLGTIGKSAATTGAIWPNLVNDRAGGQSGLIQVAGGRLDLNGPATNRGAIFVGGPGILAVNDTLDNRPAGAIDLTGDVQGTGLISNGGVVNRLGPGASSVLAGLANNFDQQTGGRGLVDVVAGSLLVAGLANDGTIVVRSGAVLECPAGLTSSFTGMVFGDGLVDVGAGALVSGGTLAPGSSPGRLTISGSVTAGPTGRLDVELGGLTAGLDHDQLAVQGSLAPSGLLAVEILPGFVPLVGDEFPVVAVTDPLGGADLDPFTCLAGTDRPGIPYLKAVYTPQEVRLVATDSVTGNLDPVAAADTFFVAPDLAAVLDPLANDHDPDPSDVLRTVALDTASTLGLAWLDASGTSFSYVPPEGFLGEDSLVYTVTDCRGAETTAQVTLLVSSPSGSPEIPTASGQTVLYPPRPNPFNPVTTIRFALAEPGRVRLAVYDVRGALVETLVDDVLPEGEHAATWLGRDGDGRAASSGVYLIRLAVGDRVRTQKAVLAR